MKFDLTNTSVSASNILRPWGIYDVVLKDVVLKEGTAKSGKAWKAIQFKFAGDKGTFDPMFFCPMENGDQRPSGETNGRKWEMPSGFEQLANTISHVVGILSPAKFAKLQGTSLDLPADFDKFVGLVKAALEPAFGKATQIKVIGDNKGYAKVPNFVSISKEGKAYVSNNWVGPNLAFSNYEMQKMNEAKNAKPTTPTEDLSTSPDASTDNNDLTFDV